MRAYVCDKHTAPRAHAIILKERGQREGVRASWREVEGRGGAEREGPGGIAARRWERVERRNARNSGALSSILLSPERTARLQEHRINSRPFQNIYEQGTSLDLVLSPD